MFIELKRETEDCLGIIQDTIYAASGSLIPLDELFDLVIKVIYPIEILERLIDNEYV